MFQISSSNSVFYALITTIIISIFITSNTAAAAKARDREVAVTYLEATGLSGFKSTFMTGVRAQVEQTFSLISKQYSSAEAKTIIDEYQENIIQAYESELNWAAINDAYISNVQASFTDSELKKATKFFESRLGRQVISHQKMMAQFGTDAFTEQAGNINEQIKTIYADLSARLSKL